MEERKLPLRLAKSLNFAACHFSAAGKITVDFILYRNLYL